LFLHKKEQRMHSRCVMVVVLFESFEETRGVADEKREKSPPPPLSAPPRLTAKKRLEALFQERKKLE